MKPKFITLDGIDGAGKSTNLAVIRQWFESHGLPVLFTREPGGTPVGEALREILLNPETKAGLRGSSIWKTLSCLRWRTAFMSFPTVLPMRLSRIRAVGAAYPFRILKCWKIGCRAGLVLI